MPGNGPDRKRYSDIFLVSYLAGFQKSHCLERFLDIWDLVLESTGLPLAVDFHELIFSAGGGDTIV